MYCGIVDTRIVRKFFPNTMMSLYCSYDQALLVIHAFFANQRKYYNMAFNTALWFLKTPTSVKGRQPAPRVSRSSSYSVPPPAQNKMVLIIVIVIYPNNYKNNRQVLGTGISPHTQLFLTTLKQLVYAIKETNTFQSENLFQLKNAV